MGVRAFVKTTPMRVKVVFAATTLDVELPGRIVTVGSLRQHLTVRLCLCCRQQPRVVTVWCRSLVQSTYLLPAAGVHLQYVARGKAVDMQDDRTVNSYNKLRDGGGSSVVGLRASSRDHANPLLTLTTHTDGAAARIAVCSLPSLRPCDPPHPRWGAQLSSCVCRGALLAACAVVRSETTTTRIRRCVVTLLQTSPSP
jgi:hypothetical protein